MNKIISILFIAALAACSKTEPSTQITQNPQTPQQISADAEKLQQESKKELDEVIRKMDEEKKRKEAARAKK